MEWWVEWMEAELGGKTTQIYAKSQRYDANLQEKSHEKGRKLQYSTLIYAILREKKF